MKNERAAYRASSDVMGMNVCASCAAEAWGLGLTIEILREGRASKTDASYGHLNGIPNPVVALGMRQHRRN